MSESFDQNAAKKSRNKANTNLPDYRGEKECGLVVVKL